MTATLSSHILDTHLGKPAANVNVSLHRIVSIDTDTTDAICHQSSALQFLGAALTDNDGRISIQDWYQTQTVLSETVTSETVSSERFTLMPGRYTLTFATQSYFEAQQITAFYPEVVIHFVISDNSHYHVPLLLSAHGYSTYRGS